MKLMIVKRLPDDVLINVRKEIFVIKAREEIKHIPSSFLQLYNQSAFHVLLIT